ncbi:MAG: bifunctional DNA primase/polymerase [Acidimicrobiales bacterium]
MSTSATPLDAALAWAARGVRVLPVWPSEKAPLTSNGLHDATTDLVVLRRWWSRSPAANVAIATGTPGVDVLDVDVRGAESGWASLRRLREAGVVPTVAPVVRTPSGGAHLYFLGTDQRNGSLPNEHLDFRSAGGYVLVPPSSVATRTYAGVYSWERAAAPNARLDWAAATTLLRPPLPTPVDRPSLRPLPSWDVRTLAATVEREREGNRNRLLFWAFCEALRSGYDLRPIAEAGLRGGQTVREVEATWRQAVKRVTADGQVHCSPAGSASNRPTRTVTAVHSL